MTRPRRVGGSGHFLQEDVAPQLAVAMIDFIGA